MERPKVATLKFEAVRRIIELRNALMDAAGQENLKENVRNLFNGLMKDFLERYYTVVREIQIMGQVAQKGLSPIARDEKWIGAWVWDEGEEWYLEVFKGLEPTREELRPYSGYVILAEDRGFSGRGCGAAVCRWIGLDWGRDSAPRFLWRYLNKLADVIGVEEPGDTFETWARGLGEGEHQ